MSPHPTSGGSISVAGRWECGRCGASGNGWYDSQDGLTLHDENDNAFAEDEHICEDA